LFSGAGAIPVCGSSMESMFICIGAGCCGATGFFLDSWYSANFPRSGITFLFLLAVDFLEPDLRSYKVLPDFSTVKDNIILR